MKRKKKKMKEKMKKCLWMMANSSGLHETVFLSCERIPCLVVIKIFTVCFVHIYHPQCCVSLYPSHTEPLFQRANTSTY